MAKKIVHLVCNAHIDPVWLWEWEEGLAETLATFRIAADFADQYDEFVFCHNEALLYQWVKEYDKELFLRIKALIRKGKWKVIGGWYLQPDCNLPGGELLVRQILTGRNFFKKEFDIEPTTAVNFDPFGHSRGLVQILSKSGYDSYLFCRPDNNTLQLTRDDFIWKGFDGSEVLVHRSSEHYNSGKGLFTDKFNRWLKKNDDDTPGLFLWGIGNHGGGPSHEDMNQIRSINENQDKTQLIHSNPEAFFGYLSSERIKLDLIERDLNPWAVGCYTSMARLKKTYRRLENEYLTTERMAAHAWLAGLMDYPRETLRSTLKDLLFCQFHDILPGSAIQAVEKSSLRKMGRALENLSEIKTEAFFSLLSGQKKALENEYPVLVYNPHPCDIKSLVTVELQAPEPNFNRKTRLSPVICDGMGRELPLQVEKEAANIRNDHRKRLVFEADLKAGTMNRFSCFLRELPKEAAGPEIMPDKLDFENSTCSFSINPKTGLISKYEVEGIKFLLPEAGQLMVIKDDPDSWGMRVLSFRDKSGNFSLMSQKECAVFSGLESDQLDPVRIIENGRIRTVVEAIFKYKDSKAVVRYAFPKKGNEIEVRILVYWMEKDKMLKWSLPGPFIDGSVFGEVVYGVQEYAMDGREKAAQKWTGMSSQDKKHGITVINDATYGFDCLEGELRSSLLRSPAYAGHPVGADIHITPPERFERRMDQGEHEFCFFIRGGDWKKRREQIQRESQIKSERLMSLCCWPDGKREEPAAVIKIENPSVMLGAVKIGESDNSLIIRLFSNSENPESTRITLPFNGTLALIGFKPFEIKTLKIDLKTKEMRETNLLEEVQE